MLKNPYSQIFTILEQKLPPQLNFWIWNLTNMDVAVVTLTREQQLPTRENICAKFEQNPIISYGEI